VVPSEGDVAAFKDYFPDEAAAVPAASAAAAAAVALPAAAAAPSATAASYPEHSVGRHLRQYFKYAKICIKYAEFVKIRTKMHNTCAVL